MKYFRLLDDVDDEHWFLSNLQLKENDNIWDFVGTGRKVLSYVPEIEITGSGEPVNISFGEFEILIVDEKTRQLFPADEVQFFPVEIILSEGIRKQGNHFIMTILNEIDCFDEELSEFDTFKENDPIRPDLAGHYKTVYKLVVDKNKIDNRDIFRVEKHKISIIVSETLRQKLEREGITGVKYREV